MSQTTATARTVRLSYDLAGLRELRENHWRPCGQWITISATAPDGTAVTITTNGGGEGEFSDDGLRQYMGTCQFSICGWSDDRARRELRIRYEEMMERKALDAELAQFEREFDAEGCGEVTENDWKEVLDED